MARDPNIEKVGELANAFYGEEDEKGCYFMTPEQQKQVIACIEAVLVKPKSEIKLWDDGETYEEWREFMEEGLAFLLEFERIHCWF